MVENNIKRSSYSDFFTGKVALVTGSASGIGKAAALAYAANGAAVVVTDTNEDLGGAVAHEIISSGGQAIFIKADVSNAIECEKLIYETVRIFGRLDTACNYAGISGELKDSADSSIENWDKVIQTNLSGVFYCLRSEIPALIKSGGGSITNISSILGQVGYPGSSAYTASKHGVVGLTKTAAIDYATRGIRINSIGPAFIETPMISPIIKNETIKKEIESLHPMNRLGKAAEVADLILFLSSDRASYLTGNFYPVDGGYLAK